MNKKTLYLISFIILTLPSIFATLFPVISPIISLIKGLVSLLLIIQYGYLFYKKRVRFNNFLKSFIIYSVYIFVITCCRGIFPFVFLKTYCINIGGIILIELLLYEKSKDLFYLIYKYNGIIILINLLLIAVDTLILNKLIIKNFSEYLLGSDNRFILYFIMQITLTLYLFNKREIKKYLIFWYVIGLITLLFVWSAAALVVFFLMLVFHMALFYHKKRINIYLLLMIVLILSISIVFFNIQNLFSFIIVDILHKSLSLSYRTNIWAYANHYIFLSPISFAFGYGFQDLSKVIKIMVTNKYGTKFFLTPIHMHNLIENLLYDGGIIGLLLYSKIFHAIIKKSKNSKFISTFQFNSISLIISALFILMIFDVFEYYPIYYMILSLLFNYYKKNLLRGEKSEKNKNFYYNSNI